MTAEGCAYAVLHVCVWITDNVFNSPSSSAFWNQPNG